MNENIAMTATGEEYIDAFRYGTLLCEPSGYIILIKAKKEHHVQRRAVQHLKEHRECASVLAFRRYNRPAFLEENPWPDLDDRDAVNKWLGELEDFWEYPRFELVHTVIQA